MARSNPEFSVSTIKTRKIFLFLYYRRGVGMGMEGTGEAGFGLDRRAKGWSGLHGFGEDRN